MSGRSVLPQPRWAHNNRSTEVIPFLLGVTEVSVQPTDTDVVTLVRRNHTHREHERDIRVSEEPKRGVLEKSSCQFGEAPPDSEVFPLRRTQSVRLKSDRFRSVYWFGSQLHPPRSVSILIVVRTE